MEILQKALLHTVATAFILSGFSSCIPISTGEEKSLASAATPSSSVTQLVQTCFNRSYVYIRRQGGTSLGMRSKQKDELLNHFQAIGLFSDNLYRYCNLQTGKGEAYGRQVQAEVKKLSDSQIEPALYKAAVAFYGSSEAGKNTSKQTVKVWETALSLSAYIPSVLKKTSEAENIKVAQALYPVVLVDIN